MLTFSLFADAGGRRVSESVIDSRTWNATSLGGMVQNTCTRPLVTGDAHRDMRKARHAGPRSQITVGFIAGHGDANRAQGETT